MMSEMTNLISSRAKTCVGEAALCNMLAPALVDEPSQPTRGVASSMEQFKELLGYLLWLTM